MRSKTVPSIVLLLFVPSVLAGISDQLQQADSLFRNKQYDQAEQIYLSIAQQDIPEAFAAQKNLAILYISTSPPQTDKADAAYKQLISNFSSHNGIAEAIYDIGISYNKARKSSEAYQIHKYNVENFTSDMYAMWSQVEIIYSHIRDNDYAAANAAVDTLLTVFAAQPTLPKEIYQVGYRYNQEGKADKALQVHRYNISCFPDDTYAMWSQVEIICSHIHDGNYSAANAEVDKLLTVFAGQPTLSKEVYQVAGRFSQAGNNQKAHQLYQYLIDTWSATGSIESRKLVVASYIGLGNEQQSQIQLDKLIADFADNVDLSKVLYWLGDNYRRISQYDKALEIYQYIIDKYPKDDFTVLAKVNIGLIYIRQGKDNFGEVIFNQILKDYANHKFLREGVFLYGQSFYTRALDVARDLKQGQDVNDYHKAISVWEMLARDFPDSNFTPQAYWCSAVVYSQELREYQKGIDYYQYIVDNWPAYEYASNAQFMIGKYYQRLKDTSAIPQSQAEAKIEHAYQAVLDNYPNSNVVPQAAIALARLNFQKAQWLDAAKYFELFIEKKQIVAPSHYVESLDPALYGISVLVAGALYDLGRSYENAGLFEQAVEAYKKLVETSEPDESHAREAKIRLMKLEGGTK